MARTNNITDFLTDVADAIKEKTGDSTAIPASQFDTKIASIETGGIYQEKSLTINQNGNYVLNPDTGYDGFDKVNLTINVSGGGSGDVKLFETEQAMQADPDASLDDLAVVYSSSVTGITETSEFDKCFFPQTVVLSEAYTGSLFGMFIDNESMGYFNGNVELDSSRFEFTGWRRVRNNRNKL